MASAFGWPIMGSRRAGWTLLVVGATAWPLGLPLGWTALGLAFFAWVAEADGIALPRPATGRDPDVRLLGNTLGIHRPAR